MSAAGQWRVALMALLAVTTGVIHAQSSGGINKPAPRSESWWLRQFWATRNEAAKSDAAVCFIGDSLTEFWTATGKESWNGTLGNWRKLNLGIAADRVEHILFRVQGTALNRKTIRAFVVLAGTNNLSKEPPDTPATVAEEVAQLLRLLKEKCPAASVILLGLPPNGEDANTALNKAVRELNPLLEKIAAKAGHAYMASMPVVSDSTGRWKPGMTLDGTHLSAAGYAAVAKELSVVLRQMKSN